jgi:hypothetical protein
MNRSCTLSVFVSRPDLKFLELTIPHLVRMCRYRFLERLLLVDTAPLAKRYTNQSGVGSHADLITACQRLKTAGVIDDYWEMDYSPGVKKRLYLRHFDGNLRFSHNYRGYPVLGSIYALEKARADYFVHFDSDMLLYQHPRSNWIAEGIELLERVPEAICVGPRPGPARDDSLLHQGDVRYELDRRGFYKLGFFTSRRYLVNRSRFFSTLPMEAHYISWKRKLLGQFTGRNSLCSWEYMVTQNMRERGMFRVDLANRDSWTLHTPDHGERFLRSLPEIIDKVESGWFPPEQAGHYDLLLDRWLTPRHVLS